MRKYIIVKRAYSKPDITVVSSRRELKEVIGKRLELEVGEVIEFNEYIIGYIDVPKDNRGGRRVNAFRRV